MNWNLVVLLTFVGLAAADYGWKTGQEYTYRIEARTVAGLHQVADQYTGSLIVGLLKVYVDSENQLTLQVQDAKYAEINQRLHEGWATPIPESQVNYKGFPAKNHPFQIHLSNGVIVKMVFDKDTPIWEVNFLKGIASQFQVDTQGKNLKQSRYNSVPHGEHDSGVFSTMEESVNGKYETLYDVSVVPEYIIQSRPELAPLPHLKGDGEFYRILKTRNFSNSDKHIIYRYGMSGHEGWSEGTNTMGNLLSRTSESSIVYTGKHNRYTIQSSVTTEKVLVAPHLYNTQKGIVVSRLNLTLEAVTSSKGKSPSVSNPRTVDTLVYEYLKGNAQHGNSGENSSYSSSSSSSSSSEGSSSSSSSSSSSDGDEYPATMSMKQGSKRIRSASWNQTKILMKQSSDRSASSSSSSSESSISSSEEYLESAPHLYDSPFLQFAPDDATSPDQREGEQVIERLVRLARQMGQALNDPSEMYKADPLVTYLILTRTASIASAEQLQKATEKLYYSEEKKDYHNYLAWQAYRDAVARSGTGPALMAMSSWIKSKKVHGNEAAQLFAVLPRTARYPTPEYMNYFFELVKSKEVQSQKFLNDSALLSFSDLVRRALVDSQSSHHRYPVHLFGPQSYNHQAVVGEQYIPYFARQLENAIAQGDSIKTQVYIRALGNTAHPKILAIFEPYLEGARKVTDFQRFLMVAHLDEFIKVHPNTARSVLFRIYQNQGDIPEVRAAAVMQLMKTNPPPQILQHMAEQTNYDHSKHVNAVVKSAIESAANSEYSTHPEFVEGARSAANLLTTENYGFQYSQKFIKSFIAKDPDTMYNEHYLAYIKGFEGAYPNSFRYNYQQKTGGYYNEPETVSFMSSTSEGFINLLFNQLHQRHDQKMPSKQGKNAQYSYSKIYDILNVEHDDPLQVEANLFFTIFGGARYYAFDNHTIEKLPEFIQYLSQKLREGFNFHESKFYSPHTVEIGFPMITGVQFTYSYEEPSMAYLAVQGKGHFDQANEFQDYFQSQFSASTDGQYQAVWAQLKAGKLGFIAPYSEQRHLAIVKKRIQFYAPMEGQFEYYGHNNTFRANIHPYSSAKHQQNLFQYSTRMYTVYQNYHDFNSYSKGKNVQEVHVRQNRTYEAKVGKDYTGYEFKVEAHSENAFGEVLRAYNAIKKQDYSYFASSFFHDLTHGLYNNYYALSYNPQNSSPEPTEFSLHYNSTVRGTKEQNVRRISKRVQSGNMAQPSDEDYRIEELVANAQYGIQDAEASVFDAYVSFAGKQDKGKYYFTAAHASSPVSEKSRFLFFISGRPYQESQNAQSFQAAAQVDFKQPRVPIFNYKQAYEANPTSYFQAQVHFDQSGSSKILFEGKMQQTEARKQYFKQHPYSSVCEKQMQQGNYILPACHNASQYANVLDKYDVSIKYENVPLPVQKVAYGFFDILRYWGYEYNHENFVGVKNPQGTLKFSAKFSENLQYLNYSLEAPSFTSYFENITVNHFAQPLLVHSPAYNQLYYFSPHYYYSTPYATCAVDNNEASTFNNRSYPIQLGNCYHVLAMSIPNYYHHESQESSEYYDNLSEFAILAKESAPQKKEVQILLGDDVVTLEPTGSAGVTVKVNGENIPFSSNKIARWENGPHEFEAYALPGKSNVVMIFNNHAVQRHVFQIYYDGHRVAVTMPHSYRNRVRGLCGTYDGEPVNDFTTSSNCVVKDYQQFIASYAVADEYCNGPSKEYRSQPKNAQCYPREVVYTDVISDYEAGRHIRLNSTRNTIGGQQGNAGHSGCTHYQPQVVREGQNTCFSLQPQAVCSSHCKPSRKVEKTILFHCLPSTHSLTAHWLKLVEKGANPDFSQKSSAIKMTALVPETCVTK